MLAGHVRLPFAKAVMINHAWRAIMVFGFQIHVFEVVKILMVLYLAWAVNAYKNDSFWIVNHLSSRHEGLKWLDTDAWKKILYIYLPILITCGLILLGSVSSALFIGFIMVVTILVGGINIKKAVLPGIIVVAVCAAGVIGLYKATDGKVFNRIGTAVSRLDKSVDYVAILNSAPKGSPEYVTARDKILQPYSAKLAIKEGGLFGKGPGESTQRYIVPVMFEDYMYSFLIEEYGLIFGGVVVIMLYISLLARGALIANYCENYFAKTAVAGLVILISGQAFMHMAINVGILPQTGQTLPMISHGNSSFLAFSVAFGIILSISRMTHVKMQKKAAELSPIVEERPDEVKASLNDLEEMDNID
jgi:cell division protein FtsW